MARNVFPDIQIPTRHAPFGGATGEWDFDVLGVDWSGATFIIAAAPNEGDTATFTLNNASAGTQGVSATYSATKVDPITGQIVGGTTIRPQVDEVTLEAISWGSTATSLPISLFWECLVTPTGAPQRQICAGTIKLYRGVAD